MEQQYQPPPPPPAPPTPYQGGAEIYIPPPAKGTAAKVWGILLIVFAVFAAFSLLINLVTMISGGADAFMIGVDRELAREGAQEIDRLYAQSMNRWSFWVATFGEVVIIALSFAAGWWLAVKPRTLGRKLALARGILVLLLVPVMGMEQLKLMDDMMQPQLTMIQQTGEMDDLDTQMFESVMRGIGAGAVIITLLFIVVINAVLIFFMTRKSMIEFLDKAERGEVEEIPQYDATMGMMHGPPPGTPPNMQ